MAWTQILTLGETVSEEFTPGAPFALKIEVDGDDELQNRIFRLQSRRDVPDALWSTGQKIKGAEIIPCFACEDTVYRVTSLNSDVRIFYNPVLTSQADRR